MPWRHLEYLVRLWFELLRFSPDILNFHGQPEGVLLAMLLRRRSLLFYDEFSFRGGNRKAWARIYRWFLERFDRLLPVSDYCREESLAYWSLSGRNAVTIPNGVNLNQFTPSEKARTKTRMSLSISGDESVLLYVGRVCR